MISIKGVLSIQCIYMFLAVNEMLKEKVRFVLIVCVIALVGYLVFFLTALAYGLASSYAQTLDTWSASGIVLTKSANNNIGRSLIFQADYNDLVGPDVAKLGVSAATVTTNQPDDVSLFGIDPNSFLAPTVSSGRGLMRDNEVVVSSSLKNRGVRLNDKITLEGVESPYTVVGFVDKASFQAAPVVYTTLSSWRTISSEVSGMGAMRDNTTVSALVTRGEEKSSYTTDRIGWQSIRDFSFELPGYRAQVLTFSLMIGFLIGIAAFVLAIFIYILTLQKKNIFGVLKAEGVPSSYLGQSVMTQVFLLSSIGLLLGFSLAIVTGVSLVGKVPFAINPLYFSGITILFFVCAALGGIASVRSVAKIDPVEAIG